MKTRDLSDGIATISSAGLNWRHPERFLRRQSTRHARYCAMGKNRMRPLIVGQFDDASCGSKRWTGNNVLPCCQMRRPESSWPEVFRSQIEVSCGVAEQLFRGSAYI